MEWILVFGNYHPTTIQKRTYRVLCRTHEVHTYNVCAIDYEHQMQDMGTTWSHALTDETQTFGFDNIIVMDHGPMHH